MNLKIIGSVIGALILAFILGRQSVNKLASETVTNNTKTEETKDKNVHRTTTITKHKNTDGSETTTTTVTEDSQTNIVKNKESESMKAVDYKKALYGVSAITAYDFHQDKQLYGLHVTKEMLGPITIGILGLSNSTIGISLGVNF